jgi:hypothetical protein
MDGIHNPLFKLIGRLDPVPGQMESFDRIDHGSEDLGPRELHAGRKLRILADLIEEIDLGAIQHGDHAVGSDLLRLVTVSRHEPSRLT